MATHHLEVERKYEAVNTESSVDNIDWSSLRRLKVDEVVNEHLEATYFDTVSGALGRNMVALRRRVGGYDQGWHIKFDDRAGARHEIHYSLLADSKKIPAAVSRFVRSLTLGESLVESVSLVTERERTMLVDDTGVIVAEVCDDRVSAKDFSTGIKRYWREWEVELKNEGLVSAADIFAECESVFFSLGIKLSVSTAKIARALGKDEAFEARRRAAGDTDRVHGGHAPQQARKKKKSQQRWEPGALELLHSALGALSSDLMLWELKFRVGAPHAVHGLRQTTRKLESILRFAVRPYARAEIDALEIDACIEALGRLKKGLSPARDIDIVGDFLVGVETKTGRVTEATQRVLEDFLAQDALEAQRSVLRVLDAEEYLRLRKALSGIVLQLEDTVELPPDAGSYALEVAGNIRRLLRSFRKEELKKLWQGDPGEFAYDEFNNEPLFRIRRAAQAGKYTLESFVQAGAVLTEGQHQLLDSCAELYQEISVLSDEQVTLNWLESAARRAGRRRLDRLGIGYLMGRSSYYAVGLRMSEHSFVAAELKKIKKLNLG